MQRLAVLLTLLLAFCLGGCAAKQPQLPSCDLIFPPQEVLKTGNYEGFLARNELLLTDCPGTNCCEVALFNLGFVHAYSKSPYYDQAKALKFFGELVKEYPQSPLSYESMAWMDLMEKNMALEKENTALNKKQRRLQSLLKSKSTTIGELREQMKKSRDIDVEMGLKEREILY
ncbi:MAG: hypothetical protein RBS57_07080 [Desulforhabdus sp.]|jgi:hypothetical protein|nr:hypothetical protein [Desulforhabdus sp.]